MIRRLTLGVAVTAMVAAFVGSASGESFFVELKDGSFRRCGNLDYKEGRGEWRMRGCAPIADLFDAPPVETPRVTPRPTYSPRPVPTATTFCADGTVEWDPVTDTIRCVRRR